MPVQRHERYSMLDAERGDPELVLSFRLALRQPEPCVYGGRGGRDVQDAASGDQPFNFHEVLSAALGVQCAVLELADDGDRG